MNRDYQLRHIYNESKARHRLGDAVERRIIFTAAALVACPLILTAIMADLIGKPMKHHNLADKTS